MLEAMAVGRDYRSYSHQLLHPLLLQHLGQMGIEHHGWNTRLLDIT